MAVANAGYESEGPEVVIPVKVAERLGLWPKLPEGTEVQAYEVAGGLKVRSYVIEDCLEVRWLRRTRPSTRLERRRW